MPEPTDTDRLDWLATRSGVALVNDDAGRWAVVADGAQNVPDLEHPIDIDTTFFIEAAKWQPTIREAIDRDIEEKTRELEAIEMEEDAAGA